MRVGVVKVEAMREKEGMAMERAVAGRSSWHVGWAELTGSRSLF